MTRKSVQSIYLPTRALSIRSCMHACIQKRDDALHTAEHIQMNIPAQTWNACVQKRADEPTVALAQAGHIPMNKPAHARNACIQKCHDAPTHNLGAFNKSTCPRSESMRARRCVYTQAERTRLEESRACNACENEAYLRTLAQAAKLIHTRIDVKTTHTPARMREMKRTHQ